jgi:hypothetical protein
MPKFARVGYARVELWFPEEFAEALAAHARAEGETFTTWAATVLGKAAGVEYTPPKMGPRKKVPIPVAGKRKKGKG